METSNKYESLKKILMSLKKILMPVGITFVVILAIVLILYIFAIPFDVYIIVKLYNYVVAKIVNITGINQWLVKGIVIIALIPLLWVLPNIYRGKYKKTARAIGFLYVGIFFLSLFFLSKDIYFTHSGEGTLKWYALTPEGVKFYDSPGIDPVYGITLKPVTPEVIRNLKLLQKGDFRVVDPANVSWFNPITGDPQIWYYQYPDGSYEFYDKPGYHPITGDPLKPATKQIYFEWKEKAKTKPTSVKSQEYSEGNKKGKEQQIAMGPRPQINEKERRLQEFKSLINQVSSIHTSKANVAMVIESKRTESGISPENALYNHLRTERANIIINFFKEESFKAKGFFREIYDGNTELLRQTDALSKIDNLILGRLSYSFQKGADKDLVSCNINFNYKVINKKGDIIRSDGISVIGPAFSEDAALERGIEILTEKYSDRIFKTVL